jgi:hypothetical protein
LTLLVCAPALAADERSYDELRARFDRLKADLDNFRVRLEAQERISLDEELRERTFVNLYGDIGFRYHMLFESNTETFNRPEYRLHLGVHGTPFDQSPQMLRYDMRLTTGARDANNKPVPTLAWQPLPGYGANPTLSVDRFLIEYQLEYALRGTLGRFPSPYLGHELLFDYDYHFQGVSQRVRFDRLFSDAFRRRVPRLELVGVQSYLAENAIGLPDTVDDSHTPIYLGGQFRFEIAPFEKIEFLDSGGVSPDVNSLFEFRGAVGVHWYQGAASISDNLGVGYLDTTTNTLDDRGRVRSKFLIGEAYAEVLVLRTQRARVRGWFHGTYNFNADPIAEGTSKRENRAFEAGLSWGMEHPEDRWDFLLEFRYIYIEADALIPEFNSEVYNTNIKGFEVNLHVQAFPMLTIMGLFGLTERENYDLPGFGRPSSPGRVRSSGTSFRMRFGLFLEF